MGDISKISRIAGTLSKIRDSIDERLVRILSEKKDVSYKDLATELEVKTQTIGRHARKMQNEGLVIVYKRDGKKYVKWIGGTPALESELIGAANAHVTASLLAEYYDSMITNTYAIFSLLFEDNYWEIIMSLKEGLTDVEMSQRTGSAISLDSIRRVLVTCDAHGLIKINMIREPASGDLIKLFEPLYRIESVNKKYLEYFIIIRGLASAMVIKMDERDLKGHAHLYEGLLDSIVPMFLSLRNNIASNSNDAESEILEKMQANYDYAPDLDRLYRNEKNWRKLLNETVNVKIDEGTDRLMIRESLSEKYQKAMSERVMRK